MPEQRIPDPTLMARLQLSVKGVDWAAGLVRPYQHRQPPGEWSPHQHVSHLLATERNVFHSRIPRMIAEDNPRLPAFDGDTWMDESYDRTPDIADVAEEFMAARATTYDLFKGLAPEQWLRAGIWGDTGEHDLAWAAERAVAHALEHFVALLNIHQRFEPKHAPRWFDQKQ